MIRLFPIVIIIQLFCLYHAHNYKAEQKWYWLIVFFPIIGSLFYLYYHFYSRENVDIVTEEVKTTFISNYKIEKLEKTLKFSDTHANRIALADEHSRLGNFLEAKFHYEASLEGLFRDDVKVIMKLIFINKELP